MFDSQDARTDKWGQTTHRGSTSHEPSDLNSNQTKLADIMAANILGLRRNIKNIAHNYTDAQARYKLWFD